MSWKQLTYGSSAALLAGSLGLAIATVSTLPAEPPRLPEIHESSAEPRYLDRHGVPLTVSYQDPWNVHDRVELDEIPERLELAFLAAEDKRFFEHSGADWYARLSAVVQNVAALKAVRGASTITEQVIRMIHPRPRTLWSRWLEGFEAHRLEKRYSKERILQFYVNQVPYARNRRGVKQAAREYFDRDLDTLNTKEMLALAVMVRSPSRLDLHKGTKAIEPPIERLSEQLVASGMMTEAEVAPISRERLRVTPATLEVDAAHFVRFARKKGAPGSLVQTTLDGSLQERVRRVLEQRIEDLRRKDVSDGAALIVDHRTNEILAWVNAGGFDQPEGGQIDMVTTPRQPGSTLKPFVYALALEKGWTAATIIDDAPLKEAVGNGLHAFRNYSRHYYGPIRLREALGNSLNVPAIEAVRFTGRGELLERLHELGIESLHEHPDFYGDGLALGNGEITLFELVSAYAVLARGGTYQPLKATKNDALVLERRSVFTPAVSSVIADILSDPDARAREFGTSSVLSLPRQTAVKTGTSNDYRDAWVVGFSDRYTVGVWMGNLDRRPMREVTGSVGPALVLRSIFSELHRHREAGPLYLSRRLRQTSICRETGLLPTNACPIATEWFRPGQAPTRTCRLHRAGVRLQARNETTMPHIVQPSPGLHLAMDPRIPDELERFELALDATPADARVEWYVNDARVDSPLWPLSRGRHVARARVWLEGADAPQWTDPVAFMVK
jgi:penicillin-binding protein 1C